MSIAFCPLCDYSIEVEDTRCPNCRVDLALATVMTENALFSYSGGSRADIPVAPEVLVPRLGQYLVEVGMLSDKHLQVALNYQKEQASKGNPILLGQALLWLGLVDQPTLDKAITEQILQLQEALKTANRELELRVESRTKDLQSALNRLTELNQMKANFIANISHELRTPLTHVKGYTELLMDNNLGELSSEQANALGVITRSIQRLEKLINDLINFSDSSKGEITLRLSAIDPNTAVQQAVSNNQEKASNKGIQLIVKPLVQDKKVLGDSENIIWVISQLIDNAIKFTPAEGKVIVSTEQKEHLVNFAVMDTGMGINPEQIEEVFDSFHQLDGSSTRNEGGTGLGLALVKRILEAHHVDIGLDSVLNRGSRFYFSLPITEKE